MPWILQLVYFFLVVIGIAVALWIGFWLFLILFALGAAVLAWNYLRAYLLAKGILNPTPGVPPGEETTVETATITVIEGDFTHVADDKNEPPSPGV